MQNRALYFAFCEKKLFNFLLLNDVDTSSINAENLTRVRDFLHLYILYKKYKKYYNNILQFGKNCATMRITDRGLSKILKEGLITMPEFKFDIVKSFGLISENKSGWVKEVNLVSWNEKEPVYDIRVWQEGHDKLGKGITLTEVEMKNLKELLNSLDI